MARKRSRGVNVSQAIRDYLDANPKVGPTEAAKAVSAQVGKEISPTYVSNVKSMSKGKSGKRGRRGRKPGRPAASARATKNGTVELGSLEAVTKLVREIGASTAKRLIDMLDWRK
jgi:hypothetical protein